MKLVKMEFTLIVLVLSVSQLFGAKLDTVTVFSESMDKNLKAVVVTPRGKRSERYPVAYILHGWSGSFNNWSNHMDLRPLADEYKMILVTPHGDYAGWYLDSELKADNQYDTHISKEVVEYIDKNYKTVADRNHRFICGLSMGGHGAVSLLARHPDIYCGAGSMSGVMELSESTKKFGLVQLIGDFTEQNPRWHQNSCINLVKSLRDKDIHLILDCGVDDFTIDSNRKMHQILMKLEIPHDYYERPGRHNWDYWTNALEFHLLYFEKTLNQLPAE